MNIDDLEAFVAVVRVQSISAVQCSENWAGCTRWWPMTPTPLAGCVSG